MTRVQTQLLHMHIDKLMTTWKSDLSDEIKQEFFQAVSVLLYGCTTWILTKHLEKKLDGNDVQMLFWINPGSYTLENRCWIATLLPSHKPFK